MNECPHGRLRKITECQTCELEEAEAEIQRLRAELETKTKLCDASIKHLKAENATLSRDYKLSLEQYDKFLKKKLVCHHCNLSFVSVNTVQVNGYVYCSEECATPYRKRLL